MQTSPAPRIRRRLLSVTSLTGLVLACLLGVVQVASAVPFARDSQDGGLGATSGTGKAPYAKGFKILKGRLSPSLRIEQYHESNYFRTDGNLIPTRSTWVNVISPMLTYKAVTGDRGQRAYRVEYEANIGTVMSSRDDDFINHRLTANASWELSAYQQVRAEYEFLRWHDRRGSGDPTDVSRPNFLDSHPDIWRSHRVELGSSLSSGSKKTLLDLAVIFYQRRYLNNDQQRRDNDRVTANLEVFRRLTPKTRWLFQINWQDIDYVRQSDADITLDSQEFRFFTGLTWQHSLKTALDLRFGYMTKDYDAPQRTDQTGFAWEVTGRWSPRPYGILELTTKRTMRESATGFGDATLISSGRLTWTQYIRPNRWFYQLSGYATKDEYSDRDRIDHRYQLSAGIYSQLRRRFLFGLEYRYETRDSDFRAAEYDNDVWMFNMDVKL